MKKSVVWIILIVFSLMVLGPLLYHHLPPYIFSPDIQYAKGKVLRVMEGELYNDPVTGFPTFHPPYFHCVLALLVWFGLDLDHALAIVIIFSVDTYRNTVTE